MAKDFLNSGILGGGAGFADGAGFRAIKTDYIGSPDYDPRFFETFPTVWASAYAFRKALEKGDEAAIEEWATLFLLHYFGVVHLASFDERLLREEYDKDLWLAFQGTYPRTKDEPELQSVGILQTDDRTVIGAYYPQVVFFPSRGRDAWQQSENLKPYLDGNKLSWNKSVALLEDENDRQRFHLHLRSITRILPRKELKDRLENFCSQKLGAFYSELATLAPHPSGWETIGRRVVDPQNLLKQYPLQKPNSKSGTIYYLLSDFEFSYQSSKLTDKISSDLPSPTLYRKVNDREISVKFAGKEHRCELGEKDEIVMLKDLFLSHSPYWCKIPKSAENFAAAVSLKHEISLQDSSLRQGDRAICLAPVKAEFFTHFPEVLDDVKNLKAEPDADGNVTWTFYVCDKEIRWRNKPINQANIPNTALAMYPPKVSPQWKLYAAYGTGNRETCGRWHLIDERGWRGQMIELEEEEYVSVLHRADGAKNRPRALLFTDAADKERGVLFLADFFNLDLDTEQTATLAMDFGTSNTCLAVDAGKPGTLKFSLSPLPLWGIPPERETPGFVPRQWSGEKGFFPTILLSRKSDDHLPGIEPDKLLLEHLFKTDIPCLHKRMSERLIANVFDAEWRIHDNLKWSSDQRTPWRSLFLQTVLYYAHAEVFFNQKAKLNKYVFTYPLAFSEDYGTTYHDRAQDAVRQIRHFCYGEERHLEGTFEYLPMDESTAIAKSLRQGGVRGLLEVFVDIGGGTADVAIRHENQFLVLDSLKVAGRSFFNIARKTLDEPELAGSAKFREHLKQLLGQDPKNLQLNLPLGALYSVQINELDDRTFREREEAIIQKGMGAKSFQRYRSQLFFSHLLGYALLQACAAAVAHKLTLSNGIKLVLGGNGWGLLLFAEWKRSSTLLQSEANDILQLLKKNLMENATEEEKPYLEKIYLSGVALLNERNLSEAKNSVALGALEAVESDAAPTNTEPYAGINIENLEINNAAPHTIRWNERWSFSAFTGIFGNMRQINSAKFAHPEELNRPIDENPAVFTGLGNTSQLGQDNLPADQWQQMNGELIGCVTQMSVEGGKLVVASGDGEKTSSAPFNYFLSRVLYPANAHRDFLDVLAAANGNLYNDKK
ncbi:MAG: hypothetical protein LH472_15580 [Pyrinomonadaceae bacterium]|nr:hypothetical protein [Pyrinomonadaceae bacterium]